MSDRLHELFFRNSYAIERSILTTLRSSFAHHYREMDIDLLRQRVVLLVTTFEKSIQDSTPVPLITHVRGIVDNRISEGILLSEIQLALTALEEKAWRLVTSGVLLEQQVDDLREVSFTIGMAKDQLAQAYLRQKEEVDARIGRLERKMELLFKGTVAPPEQ